MDNVPGMDDDMPTLGSSPPWRLRTATEEDGPLLARWRSDPRILEFYGGRDRPLDERSVGQHYLAPHRDPSTGRFYEHRACIAETGQGPRAFVQFYRLPAAEAKLVGDPPGRRTYGLDLFIAEPNLWGRGLGTILILLVRDHLRFARAAERVVSDPRVANPRSVRAFEKAGFRKVRVLPARMVHEGVPADCWLMEHP